MTHELPSVTDVQTRLKKLRVVEMDALAATSGVPVSTLWKIRNGSTPNPGLETVRKFFALLAEQADSTPQPTPTPPPPEPQRAEQGVTNV